MLTLIYSENKTKLASKANELIYKMHLANLSNSIKRH